MPLVVVCGTPGSGKTTRATQLAKYLIDKHNCNVVLINEQNLGIKKSQGYMGPNEQKITRGRIKFQIQKNLLGKTIVIADSLNYIKGFRYQMHCVAREQKTTYCVLYCNTSPEIAEGYNSKNQNGFPQGLFIELTKSMEAPQLKNRWDVPLFERRQDQPTPIQEIVNTLLFEVKKSKDPVSTKQEQKLSEDYLYQVDKICQEVCDEACMGKINLSRTYSALQARKVKTDFLGAVREKPMPLKAMKQSFIHYLVEADKRK